MPCELSWELGNRLGQHLSTPSPGPPGHLAIVQSHQLVGSASQVEGGLERNTATLPVGHLSFKNLAPGGGGSSRSATMEGDTAISVLQKGQRVVNGTG